MATSPSSLPEPRLTWRQRLSSLLAWSLVLEASDFRAMEMNGEVTAVTIEGPGGALLFGLLGMAWLHATKETGRL